MGFAIIEPLCTPAFTLGYYYDFTFEGDEQMKNW